MRKVCSGESPSESLFVLLRGSRCEEDLPSRSVISNPPTLLNSPQTPALPAAISFPSNAPDPHPSAANPPQQNPSESGIETRRNSSQFSRPARYTRTAADPRSALSSPASRTADAIPCSQTPARAPPAFHRAHHATSSPTDNPTSSKHTRSI